MFSSGPAPIGITGDFLPTGNNIYNLGSPTQRWNSIYLANNTIYLGNQAMHADDANSQITLINGVDATQNTNITTATNYACISQRQVGSNGGYAIAFAYDLNRSIVYTRQGNPAWSGQKRDGTSGPIRSDDLFYPNWVNLDKVSIPQADEQQHLLSNLIHFSNIHRKPLPRFWFLPRGFKAAVVMSGDDHASGGASTASRFDRYKSQSNSNTVDAVANWDAVRATSYIFPGTAITNTQVVNYQQEGFEIGLRGEMILPGAQLREGVRFETGDRAIEGDLSGRTGRGRHSGHHTCGMKDRWG